MKYNTIYHDTFDTVFNKLMEYESPVISNVDGDLGGLTVAGISRNYNPNWQYWSYVDRQLKNKVFKLNTILPKEFIENEVASFYYNTYWKKYDLDNVHPDIALILFDQLINPGPYATVKHLQELLNTLNYNTNEEDLVVDGLWGPKTKNKLQSLSKKYKDFIKYSLICQQGSYYLDLANKNSNQRKFVKGWINRVISHINKK